MSRRRESGGRGEAEARWPWRKAASRSRNRPPEAGSSPGCPERRREGDEARSPEADEGEEDSGVVAAVGNPKTDAGLSAAVEAENKGDLRGESEGCGVRCGGKQEPELLAEAEPGPEQRLVRSKSGTGTGVGPRLSWSRCLPPAGAKASPSLTTSRGDDFEKPPHTH